MENAALAQDADIVIQEQGLCSEKLDVLPAEDLEDAEAAAALGRLPAVTAAVPEPVIIVMEIINAVTAAVPA